jgi:hypothetical protein
MTQIDVTPDDSENPLNARQLAFARELGIAWANGGRDAELTKAYAAAGFKPDRGNARRLAADPRVKSIAQVACREALERAGLHIEYLQAKALEMLHSSPTKVFRSISKFIKVDEYSSGENVLLRFRLRDDLSADEEAELDSAAWPLSEFKIDKDGILAIKLPDKKAIIEMLAKQLGVGKDDNQTNVSVTLESLVAASMQPKEDAA